MNLLERVTIQPFGDAALLVAAGAASDTERLSDAAELRRQLLRPLPDGIVDVVGGLDSVLVEYDPGRTDFGVVADVVRLMLSATPVASAGAQQARVFDVPTMFGGEMGLDLENVADELGGTAQDVVDLVCNARLEVAFLGAAMAPMMTGIDVERPIARTRVPRTRVAGGSVMLAGRNAIITPFPGPTGWRVVGRTPLRVVDIMKDPPTEYGPGDVLRFRPISEQEWAAYEDGTMAPVEDAR